MTDQMGKRKHENVSYDGGGSLEMRLGLGRTEQFELGTEAKNTYKNEIFLVMMINNWK